MAFNAAYCLLRPAWNSVRKAANILVVDDDPLNPDLICKVLRREGYKVVEARDEAIHWKYFRCYGKGS
jgi:response regulator RpfG family c-di-GMP phosphodiesterase